MTGSFRRERDHLTLVKAFSRLLKSGFQNIEIYLIGGVLHDACKANVVEYAKKKGIEGVVKCVGTQRDVPGMLSKIDIYVASSHHETFGIALVEAMASGLPVIVSNIPPFMEIIESGKYGLHFEKGNHEELAKKIKFFMNNKYEMTHYGALSFERAAEFSIQSNIAKLESVYQEIMNCERVQSVF